MAYKIEIKYQHIPCAKGITFLEVISPYEIKYYRELMEQIIDTQGWYANLNTFDELVASLRKLMPQVEGTDLAGFLKYYLQDENPSSPFRVS